MHEQGAADPGGEAGGELLKNALDVAIRIGIILVLVAWCFQILRPFVTPIVWGAIISVAVHPAYSRALVSVRRRGACATLFVLLGLAVLIVPCVLLSDTLVSGAQSLGDAIERGEITIPSPPATVADWPIVGEQISQLWALAAQNLDAALAKITPHLKGFGGKLLSVAAGVGFGLLQFVLAIVIAGVLLANSDSGYAASRSIAARLSRTRGEALVVLAEATIRSVARGIVGVALIQSILAGLGFLFIGLPGAGLWAFLCLILAVIQIGPILILLPAAIYVFSTSDTLPAVIFLVWCIFVGVIDNFLKPILLGRGVDVPMLVIFLGAIGGFLSMGILGLFVGATVLVLGYTLLKAWLEGTGVVATEPAQD